MPPSLDLDAVPLLCPLVAALRLVFALTYHGYEPFLWALRSLSQ
jgi:hypothetical protein